MQRRDPKSIGVPNINFSCDLPENDKRNKKYKKQRMERGFDDSELWNLDSTIALFIVPRLKAFKETKVGYPSFYSSDVEFKNDIDKMIKAFEVIGESNPTHEGYSNGIVEEGLKLFHDNFCSLWD